MTFFAGGVTTIFLYIGLVSVGSADAAAGTMMSTAIMLAMALQFLPTIIGNPAFCSDPSPFMDLSVLVARAAGVPTEGGCQASVGSAVLQ